jgi:hypothetical protein
MTYADILRTYHDQSAIKAFVTIAVAHANADIESEIYLDLTGDMILALPQDLTEQQLFILTECIDANFVDYADFMRAMELRQ